MKKIAAAILLVLAIVSCKEEDFSYQGPPFVDFSSSYQYVTIKGNVYSNYTVPVKVRLGGPLSGSAYNVTFDVDASSTAVSGTHYSLAGNSTQIPANSSFGEIPVTFLIPSFPEQTSVKLVIKITGGDLKVNEPTATTTLYIYRQGFIDLFTGDYSCEEPDKPVSVRYDVSLAADTGVKNRVNVSNFWGYAKEGSLVYLDLKSTVDSVYLPTQTFTDQSDREYTVSGEGRYNINTGSITLSYTLSEDGGSFTESGQHIYSRR